MNAEDAGLLPGQMMTEKFPAFTYGLRPHINIEGWSLSIFGEVGREVRYTWDEFAWLPQNVIKADFHCVTG